MPPVWDPREDEKYEKVHNHTSGVISYTIATPKTRSKSDSDVDRQLNELRDAVRRNEKAEQAEQR